MSIACYQWWNLRNALDRSAEPLPSDLTAGIVALPPVDFLPSPWTTWLLAALVVYRNRQLWAKGLLRQHAHDFFDFDNQRREFGLPEFLTAPGLPEWEVEQFVLLGFVDLHHRVTGEGISVCLNSEDHYVFPKNLHSYLRPSSRWEAAGRMLELHAEPTTIEYAVDDLVEMGLLRLLNDEGHFCDPDDEHHAHILSGLTIRSVPSIQQFLTMWESAERRLWLAALIGDWLMASKLAEFTNDTRLISECARRAEDCRQQRLRIARCGLASGFSRPVHLHVLRDLGADDPAKIRSSFALLKGD